MSLLSFTHADKLNASVYWSGLFFNGVRLLYSKNWSQFSQSNKKENNFVLFITSIISYGSVDGKLGPNYTNTADQSNYQ